MTQIAGACKGETGRAINNKLGNQHKLLHDDQYFDELPVTGWYNGNISGKNLRIVARFIDPEKRKKIVTAVLNACNNPHIGYDQQYSTTDGSIPKRFTLRNELSKLPGGITPDNFSKISNNCACDCSELVCLCIKAACGIDFGKGISTGELAPQNGISPFLKYSNVFTTVTINQKVWEQGYGLIPGDILVWRNYNTRSGHTAIVVTQDDSYVAPEVEKQIITNVVISPSNSSQAKENPLICGQTTGYTIDKTSGPIQIAFLGDDNQVHFISKIIFNDKFKIPRLIYGYNNNSVLNVFIGDSRTLQLGSNVISKEDSNYYLQYGFFPDSQIFGNFDSTVLNSTPMIIDSAKENGINTYFWLGINDVQIYKDDFVDEHDNIQTQFVESWFQRYKSLIETYIKFHSNYSSFKTNGINKIYIVSIYPTSDGEKYYYNKQNDVIHTLNLRLQAWVNQEQQDVPEEEKDRFWLQFVWLYDKDRIKPEDTYNSNFTLDKLHFTKNWFIQNFLPKFNFNDFPGESDANS